MQKRIEGPQEADSQQHQRSRVLLLTLLGFAQLLPQSDFVRRLCVGLSKLAKPFEGDLSARGGCDSLAPGAERDAIPLHPQYVLPRRRLGAI